MDAVFALFSFAVIASFTPGPNNILVMSHGINHGFRSTLPYHVGACVASFFILLSSMLLGAQLEKILPAVLPMMKYLGCTYMLYLAWMVFTSKPHTGREGRHSATLTSGFLLQFVNPKFYLYTLTVAAVIVPNTPGLAALILYALFFMSLGILGMLTWAASGAFLQKFLLTHHKSANFVLGLSLVYCSFSLLV